MRRPGRAFFGMAVFGRALLLTVRRSELAAGFGRCHAQTGVQVLALAHLGLGSTKLVKGKAVLTGENCEVYVAKFAFTHNGHGSIKGKFWSSKKDDYFASGAHSLKVHLFPDEHWGRYQEMLTAGSLCADRVATAAYSTGTLGESHLEFEHTIAQSELLARSYYW
jgi:hypothetical protein